jgi:hypothetical protein
MATMGVMRGLDPRIHVFLSAQQDADGRVIGERSDAVLRTAMPGHDDGESIGAEFSLVIASEAKQSRSNSQQAQAGLLRR